MLDLDNGEQVSTKNTYMENTDLLEIDKIDIDKIRVQRNILTKRRMNHTNIMYFMNIILSIFH